MGSSPGCCWVQSTKDIKNGSGPCLRDTQDEVGTPKQLIGLVAFYPRQENDKGH